MRKKEVRISLAALATLLMLLGGVVYVRFGGYEATLAKLSSYTADDADADSPEALAADAQTAPPTDIALRSGTSPDANMGDAAPATLPAAGSSRLLDRLATTADTSAAPPADRGLPFESPPVQGARYEQPAGMADDAADVATAHWDDSAAASAPAEQPDPWSAADRYPPAHDNPAYERDAYARDPYEREAHDSAAYEPAGIDDAPVGGEPYRGAYQRDAYDQAAYERDEYEQADYERADYEQNDYEQNDYERANYDDRYAAESAPAAAPAAAASDVASEEPPRGSRRPAAPRYADPVPPTAPTAPAYDAVEHDRSPLADPHTADPRAFDPRTVDPPVRDSAASPPAGRRRLSPAVPADAATAPAAPRRAGPGDWAHDEDDLLARPNDAYVIAPEDNYWTISKKLYGTGAYFKALYEHNRREHPRADRLRVGDVISAPAAEALAQTYPDLCPQRPGQRAPAARGPAAATSTAAAAPHGAQRYVVQRGDTLFDIARYELGQASRWVEIYELNRPLLGDDVDHLSPGTELLLPAAAHTADRPGSARRY